MHVIIAFHLIQFTGPHGQPIGINPMEVVSIRPVRATENFGKDIKCLIHTTDGKFVAVVESCDVVKAKLEEDKP